MSREYWECIIEEALGDADIVVTSKQKEILVEYISSSAGVSSEYTSHSECIQEKKEVIKEPVVCSECKGEGEIIEPCGSAHYSVSSCSNCNGKGFKYY